MTKQKESLMLSYYRICQDMMHDSEHRLYTKDRFLKILKYLEDQEKYEECQNLLNIMTKRFDHKINFKINNIKIN